MLPPLDLVASLGEGSRDIAGARRGRGGRGRGGGLNSAGRSCSARAGGAARRGLEVPREPMVESDEKCAMPSHPPLRGGPMMGTFAKTLC